MKVRSKRGDKEIIIKPVAWRQIGFTLFLLISAAFFSMVGYIGLFFSWLGTIVFFLLGVFNLLDFVGAAILCKLRLQVSIFLLFVSDLLVREWIRLGEVLHFHELVNLTS